MLSTASTPPGQLAAICLVMMAASSLSNADAPLVPLSVMLMLLNADTDADAVTSSKVRPAYVDMSLVQHRCLLSLQLHFAIALS